MTSLKLTLCIFSILCSFSMLAQDQMERLYRSNRQNAGLDVVQTSDEGYLILSAGREPDSTDFDFYTVTKLDNKGNLSWSKDYQFELNVNQVYASITLLESDSFIVSGILELSANAPRFLMKCDPSGEVVWTKGFEDENSDKIIFIENQEIAVNYRNGLLIAGLEFEAGPFAQLNINFSETDASGNLIWAKTYSQNGLRMAPRRVRVTRDSGAIITGFYFDAVPGADIFLVKTDSVGVIEWSRQYGELLNNETASAVVQTPDDGYLISGVTTNDLGKTTGLLIKTDTIGETQWVTNIDFETNDVVVINDVIIAADGNAIISGVLLEAVESFAFMVKLDMAGNIIWKRRYKASTQTNTFANGLQESIIGGFVYLTTSDENGEQVGPYLIKTDESGETLCDSIITEDLFFPIAILADTLVLLETEKDFVTPNVIVTDTLNYGGFNPPTVSLENFGPFCPDEIFSVTYDATVDGAVGYEWSTDETTAMITVSEFGEYMVTVTMGEDYCYILCTSSVISEIPPPMVAIGVDDASYCNTGEVTLQAGIIGDIVSIEWSTGDTTQSIQVTNDGNYSVTVTNQCDDIATDAVTLTIDDTPPPITITPSGTYCATGEEILTATVPTEYVDNITWSTGETTPIIVVNAGGTYTATVTTAFCGESSASQLVDDDNPPSISIASTATLCETGADTLIAIVLPQFLNNITWSTGETTASIIISSQGTYTATVSSICGDNSAELELTCPIDLEVPNTFTPNNDNINDGFKPVHPFAASDFLEYKFAVYNRWGEKVFETTNPDEAWDGTLKGENAIADVYMWTLEGKTEFFEISDPEDRAGDVTLIR